MRPLSRSAFALLPFLAACGRTSPPPPPEVQPEPVVVPDKPRVRIEPLTMGGTDMPLFPDEEQTFRTDVERFLRDTDQYNPIPIAEIERVAAVALAGQRLSTGEACGEPSQPAELLRSVYADALVVEPRMDCENARRRVDKPGLECDLVLALLSTPADAPRAIVRRWKAPLEKNATPAEIRAAVGQLRDTPLSTKRYPVQAPNFDALPPGEKLFPGGKLSWDFSVTWFPAPTSGPRVKNAEGQPITVSISALKAADESVTWANTGIDYPTLARCFVKAPSKHASDASVRFQVSAKGGTEGVDVTGLERVDDAARTCAISVLKGARFACPQAGKPVEVTAKLSVAIAGR